MNNRIGNFRMFCWIDNSVVKFFSNLHLGSSDEKGLKGRKRPKLNGFNNKNVCLVWGEEFINVDRNTIPTIIDQYNHWMLDMDMMDQLIALLCPKIRCCRTRVPIMLHCFDVMCQFLHNTI